MIEVKDLTKEYQNGEATQRVLDNLNFTIGEGEFVAIIGPSGAGKSTLLYQISLLDEPTSGSIVLNNIDVSKLSQNQKTAMRLKELGYVFQDYALLPELSAAENVMLPLLMQGMSKSGARELAFAALDQVGLKDKHDFIPSKLSGGQQQRVSIARAIGHNPHIMFADEPTANLDSANSALVIESFIRLHKAGQTIVMVTHEMEYAKMASRILALRDGKIESDTKQ
jgi:putative ABC transport system ATP-binding protein